MTEANERQIGGDHYKKMPLEHWDLAVIYNWDPFQYQISKYMMRWRDKGGLQDLEKVVHFAQKYLEIETLRKEGNLTLTILKHTIAKLMREEDDVSERDSSAGHASTTPAGTACPGFVDPTRPLPRD